VTVGTVGVAVVTGLLASSTPLAITIEAIILVASPADIALVVGSKTTRVAIVIDDTTVEEMAVNVLIINIETMRALLDLIINKAAIRSLRVEATIVSVVHQMPVILLPLTIDKVIRSKAATDIAVAVEPALNVILSLPANNLGVAVVVVIGDFGILGEVVFTIPELRVPATDDVLILTRSGITGNHTRENGAINKTAPLTVIATARVVIDVRLATVTEIEITISVTVESVAEHVADTSLSVGVTTIVLAAILSTELGGIRSLGEPILEDISGQFIRETISRSLTIGLGLPEIVEDASDLIVFTTVHLPRSVLSGVVVRVRLLILIVGLEVGMVVELIEANEVTRVVVIEGITIELIVAEDIDVARTSVNQI